MQAYIYSVMRAFSRLINAVIGGWSGETISGRAWRENIKWLVIVLDTVWEWLGDGKNHCKRSWILDKEQQDYPKHLEHDENSKIT
jgi:hypothetical protein